MKDYNQKTVYLGIDVHKKTYSLTAISEGQIVKKDTIPAKPSNIVNYCEKFFFGAKIFSAYEAGFCGFHLHRILMVAGINNIVVHPASIEIMARDRIKTDKRDSLKIAVQLSVGRLKGIYVPSEKMEYFRVITRIHEAFVRLRHRAGCKLKSLMYEFGLIACDDNRKVSEKYIHQALAMKIHPAISYCLKEHAMHWLYLNERLKEFKSEIKLQGQIDPFITEIYESYPGIGIISARILANELGDMSQFPNEKNIYSYTGLTPQEYSSGENKRLGHISHQGKPIIRKILVQAAWIAIEKDASLKAIFERIAIKAGRKKAIVAIARRSIGRIRSCLKSKTKYKIASIELVSSV